MGRRGSSFEVGEGKLGEKGSSFGKAATRFLLSPPFSLPPPLQSAPFSILYMFPFILHALYIHSNLFFVFSTHIQGTFLANYKKVDNNTIAKVVASRLDPWATDDSSSPNLGTSLKLDQMRSAGGDDTKHFLEVVYNFPDSVGKIIANGVTAQLSVRLAKPFWRALVPNLIPNCGTAQELIFWVQPKRQWEFLESPV